MSCNQSRSHIIQEPIIIAVLALLASFASVVWNILANRRQFKSNQIRRVQDLFATYFTMEMLESRRIGWHYLATAREREEQVIWSALWKRSGDGTFDEFNHLYRVLSFWALMYSLWRQEFLEERLMRELFTYQFRHWQRHVQDLVKNTDEHDWDKPDIFKPFRCAEFAEFFGLGEETATPPAAPTG